MGTPHVAAIPGAGSRARVALGIVLVGAGLLGHLLAARAIGGTYVAYRDHMLGFGVFALVSGAIVAALGWRFWRGRPDITVLTFGILQALLGLVAYVTRFSVHG